jgi:xylulokinase
MHSLVALDSTDRVIRPAILWSDGRTSRQCRNIEEVLGQSGLRDNVANPALEGFTLPKILWLADEEPESYSQIASVLLPKDYVRLRLCGTRVMDPSDAAGTLMFDVVRGDWSGVVLEALGINLDWLPEIVGSGEVSGNLSAEAAEHMGLPPGIPVAGGGADNAASAIGSAVTSPGTMMVSIGTGGTVVAPVASPTVDPQMRLHAFNHAAPATWYLMGVSLSSGSALAWWRSHFANEPGVSFDSLVDKAAKGSPGSDGLTFLPYLTGERTPHADANARGVFYGLHAGHTRADMTRAVMEGVTFALQDSHVVMKELGAASERVVMAGGGARSPLWRQMLADVFRAPVYTVVGGGGAPYGAAILGACAGGRFDNPALGAGEWVRLEPRADSNDDAAAAYEAAYERYAALYPLLKERFARDA